MGRLSLVAACVFLASHSYGASMAAVYDTIVVGLGASGSAAASTLARAGKKVLALEAQDRIGGRVWTVPFGDGLVELGAEWVHGTESSPVYELATTNNITLAPQDITFNVFFSDGVSDKRELLNEITEYALKQVEHPPEKPEPLGQFLTRKVREHINEKYPAIAQDEAFITSLLEFLDLLIDNYESSNSWNDVTTQSCYEELGGHQHMSWRTNGYKTLFELLMNTHNNGPGYPSLEIKLNTEVTQIQWPQDAEDNVVVTTRDGASYAAKSAIVTLSVGVLKERSAILFSPPLPSEKSNAIEAIKIGLLDKVILYFEQPWWAPGEFFNLWWSEHDTHSIQQEDRWITKITMMSNPMGTKHALTVWFSGDRARLVETLPDDEVKSKVMWVIRKFMGAGRTIPEPVDMLRTYWQSNPYTRGSYSYDSTRGVAGARAALGAPLRDAAGAPRLLFAGEATDHSHFSTVHGAVASGFREANRLLPSSKI